METKAAEISAGDVPILTDSDVRGLVDGVHVVVVRTSEGRHRRRVLLNLPAAQRAVDRAILNGHSAHMVLCQLVVVSGGDK